MPPGYRLEEGGAVEQSAKGQRSVLAVIPVMLVLMLFILMVQLQSVQKPPMVMLTGAPSVSLESHGAAALSQALWVRGDAGVLR